MPKNSKLVVIYQPHQNTRQHSLADDYKGTFDLADKVYWLDTYLTREDPNLAIISASALSKKAQHKDIHVAKLDNKLAEELKKLRDSGFTLLFLGAGSIDDWVRQNFV